VSCAARSLKSFGEVMNFESENQKILHDKKKRLMVLCIRYSRAYSTYDSLKNGLEKNALSYHTLCVDAFFAVMVLSFCNIFGTGRNDKNSFNKILDKTNIDIFHQKIDKSKLDGQLKIFKHLRDKFVAHQDDFNEVKIEIDFDFAYIAVSRIYALIHQEIYFPEFFSIFDKYRDEAIDLQNNPNLNIFGRWPGGHNGDQFFTNNCS
jgi:hypothetical protein